MNKVRPLFSVLFFGWILVGFDLQAQDVSSRIIKMSDEYYWGEAHSVNGKEAYDQALAELIQSIAVKVTSAFRMETNEQMKENRSLIEERSQSIVNSYAGATLKNVKTIRTFEDEEIVIFHYILKRDVEQIFNERKELIKNIFDKARQFEEKGNIGYALKWYYFSIVLMNSIPEQQIMYGSLNLMTEIPYKVNEILRGLIFNLTDIKWYSSREKEITLKVTMNEKPVSYLDIAFFDGIDQVTVSVNDGISKILLTGNAVQFKKLIFNVKYSYYENRQEIKEVAELWNLVEKPVFKSQYPLEWDEDLFEPEESPYLTATVDVNQLNDFDSVPEINAVISREILQHKETFRFFIGNINRSIEAFTRDPFLRNKLASLLKFNASYVTAAQPPGVINGIYNGYEYRKMEVLNTYKTLNKQSKEYLILDYDTSGEFSDVNFGIMDNLYNEFVEQAQYGNDWGNRQVIIKFMERYRTAYMTRDMEMLNTLFADEAVIIVGRVMRTGKKEQKYEYEPVNVTQPSVEYLKYTKDEYLKRQEQIFQVHKDIFLGYTDFQIIRKNNQPGVYGISLRQNYHATNYSDEGYLFLLVDFNDEVPQIFVRSWQPNEWNEQSLIRLSNFKVSK